MLKAVENPSGDIAQGVMVTPEGGYVVAQPDLYVSHPFNLLDSMPNVLSTKRFLAETSLACSKGVDCC
jgi:hypothetical protein